MPLFFAISGLTLSHKYVDAPIDFIKKQLLRVYVPYLLLQILWTLTHNLFVGIGVYPSDLEVYSIQNLLKRLFISAPTCNVSERLGGMLWFLPALLFSTVIYILVLYFTKRMIKNEHLRCAAIFFLVLAITVIGISTHFSRHISSAFSAMIFVWFGDMCKPLIRKTFRWIHLMLVALGGYALVIAVAPYNEVLMVANKYGNKLLFPVMGIVGTISTWALAKMFDQYRESKTLAYLGSHTMPIFCWHFVVFYILNCIVAVILKLDLSATWEVPTITLENGWVCLIYLLCGILVPLGFEYVTKIVRRKIYAS